MSNATGVRAAHAHMKTMPWTVTIENDSHAALNGGGVARVLYSVIVMSGIAPGPAMENLASKRIRKRTPGESQNGGHSRAQLGSILAKVPG